MFVFPISFCLVSCFMLKMCLHTSALRKQSNEINGMLLFKNNINMTISQMKCICKAGAYKKCKHDVAILLYINKLIGICLG